MNVIMWGYWMGELDGEVAGGIDEDGIGVRSFVVRVSDPTTNLRILDSSINAHSTVCCMYRGTYHGLKERHLRD